MRDQTTEQVFEGDQLATKSEFPVRSEPPPPATVPAELDDPEGGFRRESEAAVRIEVDDGCLELGIEIF